MTKKLQYSIATGVLTMGLIAFLYGSLLVINTYKRESLYIETTKIGKVPVEKHLKLVEQRGLKNGLLHILLQGSGALIAVVGGVFLAKTNGRRGL